MDFQNFGLTRRARCDRPFSTRWVRLERLLDECRLDLAGRLVLDPDCRDGAGIAASLSRGAAWGVGWCSAADADPVEASLLAAGFTRFTIVRDGTDIDVERGVPAWLHDHLPQSVAFCEADGVLRIVPGTRPRRTQP